MSERAHIFVVDDEAPARDMVRDYLRMHGFEVTACDGGASLRQVLARQSPDLIVLDLNMPDEDGLTIIRRLKQEIVSLKFGVAKGDEIEMQRDPVVQTAVKKLR